VGFELIAIDKTNVQSTQANTSINEQAITPPTPSVHSTISINGVLHPECLEMFYNTDPKAQIDNVERKAKIKVGDEWIEAQVHPTTVISRDQESTRPRATLTQDIIHKINPPMVGSLDGDVVHIRFASGCKNTEFFASSTSENPLLKQLYDVLKNQTEVLLKEIPDLVWNLDTFSGSKYLSLGFSLKSGTQGSPRKLPFLRLECRFKLLMDISKIYAKILGIKAAIINKYLPETYKTNHETYI
jgi:hypothetical protein